SSAVASFSAGAQGRERVVVVAEVARHHKPSDDAAVIGAIRGAVADELGVRVDEVVLIRQGVLPKTSSGKLQRRLTRARYESGELALSEPAGPGVVSMQDSSSRDRANDIRAWLREFSRTQLDSRDMDERRTIPAEVTRALASRGLFGLQ